MNKTWHRIIVLVTLLAVTAFPSFEMVQAVTCAQNPGASFCIPTAGEVTRGFKDGAHSGVDISGSTKPGIIPVYSAFDGTVVFVGRSHGCSGTSDQYAIGIRDDKKINGKNILALYTHMGHWVSKSHALRSYVSVPTGTKVKKGQLIGYQGDAPKGEPGCTSDPTAGTGVHLHFSIFESSRAYLDSYSSWGTACKRFDLWYELGGFSKSCPQDPNSGRAVNPEATAYLGLVSSSPGNKGNGYLMHSRLYIDSNRNLTYEVCGVNLDQDLYYRAWRAGWDFGLQHVRATFGNSESCMTLYDLDGGGPVNHRTTYYAAISLSQDQVGQICSSKQGLCDSIYAP